MERSNLETNHKLKHKISSWEEVIYNNFGVNGASFAPSAFGPCTFKFRPYETNPTGFFLLLCSVLAPLSCLALQVMSCSFREIGPTLCSAFRHLFRSSTSTRPYAHCTIQQGTVAQQELPPIPICTPTNSAEIRSFLGTSDIIISVNSGVCGRWGSVVGGERRAASMLNSLRYC